MSNDSTPKKKAWPLSLNSTEITEIEGLMKDRRQEDRTEFVLAAIRQTHGLQPDNPDLLVNLAGMYHPTLRHELARATKEYLQAHPGANPAKMVAYFLDELAQAMRANRDLTEPFRLISASQQREWEGTRGEYEGMLQSVFRKLGLIQQPGSPAVAEPQGEYGKPAAAVPMASRGAGHVSVTVQSSDGKKSKLSTRRGSKLAKAADATGQPKLSPHPSEQAS